MAKDDDHVKRVEEFWKKIDDDLAAKAAAKQDGTHKRKGK